MEYIKTHKIKKDGDLYCEECEKYLGIDGSIFSYCPFCGIRLIGIREDK